MGDARRSNNTLTSGLVVHDVATTNSSHTDRALWIDNLWTDGQGPQELILARGVTVLDLHGIGSSPAHGCWPTSVIAALPVRDRLG